MQNRAIPPRTGIVVGVFNSGTVRHRRCFVSVRFDDDPDSVSRFDVTASNRTGIWCVGEAVRVDAEGIVTVTSHTATDSKID